jgi:hypothetical protein
MTRAIRRSVAPRATSERARTVDLSRPRVVSALTERVLVPRVRLTTTVFLCGRYVRRTGCTSPEVEHGPTMLVADTGRHDKRRRRAQTGGYRRAIRQCRYRVAVTVLRAWWIVCEADEPSALRRADRNGPAHSRAQLRAWTLRVCVNGGGETRPPGPSTASPLARPVLRRATSLRLDQRLRRRCSVRGPDCSSSGPILPG